MKIKQRLGWTQPEIRAGLGFIWHPNLRTTTLTTDWGLSHFGATIQNCEQVTALLQGSHSSPKVAFCPGLGSARSSEINRGMTSVFLPTSPTQALLPAPKVQMVILKNITKPFVYKDKAWQQTVLAAQKM